MMSRLYSPPSSHCWTSQTPTARPTVRLHSSIRKTRGSTRRGWRPSWSRAGWTSELFFTPSPLPFLLHHTLYHHPSTPVSHFYLIKRKKQQLYQKKSSATLKGEKRSREQPNQKDIINLLANTSEENEGGGGAILHLCSLSLIFPFFYCMMWNKLLLTEFVIYLCCMAGLMLVVLHIFLYKLFILFYFFGLLVWTQLGCSGKGHSDDKSRLFWTSDEQKRLLEYHLHIIFSQTQSYLLLF